MQNNKYHFDINKKLKTDNIMVIFLPNDLLENTTFQLVRNLRNYWYVNGTHANLNGIHASIK